MATILYNGKPLDQLTPEERARYDRMGKGSFDEMLRTGRGPLLLTDTSLQAGWDNANGKQFEDQAEYGDMALAKAKAAGVSTNGKMYLSGLASEAGDPTAWVESKADIRRIAEQKRMNVEGCVTVKALRPDEPAKPQKRLAKDIVRRLGGTTPEKAAAIREKHGFKAAS